MQHRIVILPPTHERAEVINKGLLAGLAVWGGTIIYAGALRLVWEPDTPECDDFETVKVVLDAMVEYGVLDPHVDTYGVEGPEDV